jgi:hypothetical protein
MRNAESLIIILNTDIEHEKKKVSIYDCSCRLADAGLNSSNSISGFEKLTFGFVNFVTERSVLRHYTGVARIK